MKVYITGKDNYIAGYLQYFLTTKRILAIVASVSITNYNLLVADMSACNPDIVIHVAQSTKSESFFTTVNILGTKNVIRAMQAIQCGKIIFSSTIQLYNRNAISTESSVVQPTSSYAVSKLLAEQIIFAADNINSIIVRCCDIVGYWKNSKNTFFDKLYDVTKAENVIHASYSKYEYVALYDMAMAYYLLLNKFNGKSTIFNLTCDNGFNKIVIVAAWQKYLKKCKKDRVLVIIDQSSEKTLYPCSNNKLKLTTGWSIKQNIEDIISSYPLKY